MNLTTKQWAALAIVLCLLAALVVGWQAIHDRRIDNILDSKPQTEIKNTDMAIQSADKRIIEYRMIRQRLPEVIENAQLKARSSVDALSDDAVADEWNTRLGQYRDKAAGVSADQ